MQSTAALKDYIDTTIKDILYNEANEIAELTERLESSEALIGLLLNGFQRVSTIASFIQTSGGSARINVKELCEALVNEIDSNIIGPLDQAYYLGNEIPYDVKKHIADYKYATAPEALRPFLDEEYTPDPDSDVVADIIRDE